MNTGRMKPAILSAFFTQRDDAERAYRVLKGQGVRRIAVIHKSTDGRTVSRRRLNWLPVPHQRRILAEHSSWLTIGESVLVMQGPILSFRRPVALLRENGDSPPAIFFLNHKQKERTDDHGLLDVPLSAPRIRERSRSLAQSGTATDQPRGETTLLNRLKVARRWLGQVCSELSGAAALGQRTSPVVEWILDNQYVVESTIQEVRQNLSRRFYRELPVLESDPHGGLPRVYALARQIVDDHGLSLNQDSITSCIDAYQSVHPLNSAELWAIPQMLRIALIEKILSFAAEGVTELRERERADFWAFRLITAGRRDPALLFSMMARLTAQHPTPSRHFSFQLMDHLYGEDAPAVLVGSWLERVFHQSIVEVNTREQDRQARGQVAIGSAFTSLRELAQLDWRDIFEAVSLVESTLRGDPAGIYAGMDFASRDMYRRAVELAARRSGRREDAIAREVIDLASQGDPVHAGVFLVGSRQDEMNTLAGATLPVKTRLGNWIRHHHTGVYLWGIGMLSALLLTVIWIAGSQGLTPATVFFVLLLAAIPVSQLALETVNYLVIRFFPPRRLVKMNYEDTGIPDGFRTLVVVPMILTDLPTIDDQVQKLEIRYLANRDKNLLFSLFSDFTDSDQLTGQDDDPLLQRAVTALEGLNQRHPEGQFMLFHRDRVWCETERKFIGWERKRGKLEELNRLIDRSRDEGAGRIIHVGNEEQLRQVRFVITLDGDTGLPAGTARRMIETLAHPLNQPRFDPDGTVAAGTFTIIQPRVSPSLPSSSGSPFSRLYAYSDGMDPYTRAVSDVYQDLTGEGSYHGKGIYDVHAFSRAVSGVFPEQRLLSHDLIEGAHVRVGLASDIELLDEFPQDYLAFTTREHRWIRGDWQIADWLLPRVPGGQAGGSQPGGGQAGGGHRSSRSVPNPLTLINRWKIFDNLRRSLVSGAAILLLGLTWTGTSTRMTWTATILVAGQLFFSTLVQPVTMSTTRNGYRSFSLSRLGQDLLLTLARVSLIPHQALLAADAILRVAWRRLVSHRHLLEWTITRSRRSLLIVSLGLVSLTSALVGGYLLARSPRFIPAAAPWLILWILSPVVAWLLCRHPRPPSPAAALAPRDTSYLRTIARRSWRYYADFVTPENSWLPPDNYQVSHQNRLAMRTSPTNIGLWMMSACSAAEFGYLTADQVFSALTATMKTISRLERYRGHLLNWYDLATLKPLEPRYVSTVDSGNLLGLLWSLEQGLESLIAAPILGRRAFAGLADTAAVLQEEGLEDLIAMCRTGEPPGTTEGLAALLDNLQAVEKQAGLLRAESTEEGIYWSDQIQQQLSALVALKTRYLRWVDVLGEKSDNELAPLGDEVIAAVHRDRQRVPSLRSLATGTVRSIRLLKSRRTAPDIAGSPLAPWIDRVIEAFSISRWLAGEELAIAGALIDEIRALSRSMDMRFLYDTRRDLFVVGYNVADQRPDKAFYDLLASEARLGSFVAVARGDVPVEHWFTMGRPHNAVGRRRVLLSWTGTMFEYLMPLLLLTSHGNSLLDKATRQAVAIQIDYGRRRHVPWGNSESAFADLDMDKTYQYKAFGVPALGLKRGLVDELVVAPYASLLALEIAPREALRNLRKLDSLGLLKDYGFYDAIDYSRQKTRDGEPGVIVRTYMSHHQGMGFLALTNCLHDGAVRRLFHRDTRVRAYEPLLHESVPALSSRYLTTRDRTPPLDRPGEIVPSVSRFDSPHTSTPKTQLLGNGRYSLMVTNTGGGYSQWNGIEINRWRGDSTIDSGGMVCYLYEEDTDRLWSNGYHPVCGPVETCSADFALDRALLRRIDNGVETRTEIVVSPEDDVEIRRITLVNRSLRPRKLTLTSYTELSLAPHRADLQHPGFNKLFIQTEASQDGRTLMAYRRLRRAEETPVYAAHRIIGAEAGPMNFDTDRSSFIGRGRTLADPIGARESPKGSQGYVLDPVFSLQATVTLAPAEQRQLTLVLATADSRQSVLNLVDTYHEPRAIERAMDYAWVTAQIELRSLRIKPDEARRFQQIASHLIFAGARLRPVQPVITNRKGQSGLWPYGISGDAPILLVTIGDTRDIELVRQVLRARLYWRARGFAADLVILNEESGGYERPLRDQLAALTRSFPEGVFLLDADQLPREDHSLLMAASRVVLIAARGTLAQQLGLVVDVPALPKAAVRKRVTNDPSAELPFMELDYFNGLGGFTPGGREYAIYLRDHRTNTPAPWVNVIANPTFGTVVSETGAGFTWYGNSQRNRLTAWSNDPVIDPPTEALYIRDEESGRFWTPTAAPIREESAYRARHGAGYSVFEHNSHGIEQELTVFVPVDDAGGAPVKLQRLRLKNTTNRVRTLSVTYYLEWTLGENRESSQMHVTTAWDETAGAIFARQRYHPDYGDRVSFTAITPPAESWTADRTLFLGRNGSPGHPAGMDRVELASRAGVGLDPCSALQTTLEIAPGATGEVLCLTGQTETPERARELISEMRNPGDFAATLERTISWWDGVLGTVAVHTPEAAVNILVNRWLLYQSLSCRIWGRSATYQSGGAFGFRDQLQDAAAFVHTLPDLTRGQILLAASRQFTEGDVQHWWHPPGGAGIRSRISDDLLWLPAVVAHYVQVTGDTGILEQTVPFLTAPQLEEAEHEVFAQPEVSDETATVFEHCRRAVERGLTSGPQGLPLMGTGDWNDGMNLVGAAGRGESVWLAWFLVDVLNGMAQLAALTGDHELAGTYTRRRTALISRIEEVAWDGDWYLRAFFDDGTPLGSAENQEARIDSLPQSWARISGGGDEARGHRALESAWDHLVKEDEGLVLLFAPPFEKREPSPGYIKGYPPGIRENGGQYTHAALWFAIALARGGQGDKAAQLLRLLNPIEHTGNQEAVQRYRVEPYVIAADVYRLPGRVGRGGWSWYTGSAAWMYRAWVEEVLGLEVRGEEMRINPVIPRHWDGFDLRYRHGQGTYQIRVENPEGCQRGVAWVDVDGEQLSGHAVIPLDRGAGHHRVLVQMGDAERASVTSS